MSGYWPTILELTPSPLPYEMVVRSVLGLLEHKHFAKFHVDNETYLSLLFHCSSSAVIGCQEAWIEVDFEVVSTEIGGVRVTLKLASEAFEAAYDVIEQHLNYSGWLALLEFCADVAEAIRASGFWLRFDQGQMPSITINELSKALTSVDSFVGLVCGVNVTSPLCMDLERYWPKRIKINTYQMIEFIS